MAIRISEVIGIPTSRRHDIEAAVIAGGQHTSKLHRASIVADPFSGWNVFITGPGNQKRFISFWANEGPTAITAEISAALNE